MKPRIISSKFRILASSLAALLAGLSGVTAATIYKSNNTNALNLTTSWSGGVVPGGNDIAAWDFTVNSANSTVLGADLAWNGISITDPAGPVTIGAGNTLTLGSSGIDMSFAIQNLTISSGLTLSGGQNWNVASGRTLTLGTGTFTRSAGAALTVNGGEGLIATTNITNTNGIVGPWAAVNSSGVYSYATVNAGNIEAYTAPNIASTAAGSAWAGIPSTGLGADGVSNWDITVAGTFATSGNARNVNTIRYVGVGAARQNSNSTSVAGVGILTSNGFMNAGSGAFTIGGDPGAAAPVAANGRLNVTIGLSKELVLAPMSADIVFNGVIANNGTAPVASGVTVLGNNKVILNGNSTYTGPTVISGGTLQVASPVATFGSINTTSGITINGPNAKYLHTSSVASTRPITLTRGILDGTGTLGPVTVTHGTGGILTHGNGTSSVLTMGSLTFGGAGAVNATLTGGTAPLSVTGTLATTPANGTVTLNVASAPLANGLHNVISYGSLTGAPANFTANVTSGLSPRQFATVALNGSNIALQVSGDIPKWTGARNDGQWTTTVLTPTKNWALATGGTPTDFLALDNVLFDDTATGGTALELSDGNISTGTMEFNNSSKNYSISSTLGFAITSGTLTKNGTGSLTISTANSYSNGTTFNGGSLHLNNASAIGSGALTIGSGSGKTLDNSSGSAIALSGNPVQNWNDDFTFTGSNALDLGTGAVTVAGGGTNRTLTVSAGTLTAGELKAAAHGLIKQGAGTLVLTSAGTGATGSAVSGTLDIAAGTLQINRTGSTGGGSGDFTATGITGTGTISNGANDERWLFVNTTGTSTFTGTLTNGGSGGLGFDKQGTGSLTLSGTLSYTGLTTVEGGVLTIPVTNSGAGTNVSVTSGTVVMGHPSAFGAVSTIRLAGNNLSTLDMATDGGDTTYGLVFGTTTNATIISNRATPGEGINHPLNIIGTNGVGGGTLTVTSGPNVTSGIGRITFSQFGMAAGTTQTTTLNPTTANVTLGGVSKVANTPAQTLELGGTSSDNQITGPISNGTATVSLAKSNSSTWTLSSASTYTGNTQIGTVNGAGVLRATASNALGTGTVLFDVSGGNPGPTSRLELSNDITLPNNITLYQRNNTSAQIESVSGNNTLSGSIDVNAGGSQGLIQSDAGLLTLSGPISTTSAVARNLHLGGAGNGVATNVISSSALNPGGILSITKDGSGTWTLSGANTYNGTTTVNDGTLGISQPVLADTAAVRVGATAVLNLTHSATDTVDRFFINGVEQAAGTWGSLTSSATNKTARITGTGILQATNGTAAGGYNSWAAAFGLDPLTDGAAGFDKDLDGYNNSTEYILGGSPVSGSNNPKIYPLVADSSADGDALSEQIVTIAVPVGTPVFSAGAPTSTATFETFGITVRGSTDLVSFPVTITPVTPIVTGLPSTPFVSGGISYEYRSFSLGGSNNLAGKGFLQVAVSRP